MKRCNADRPLEWKVKFVIFPRVCNDCNCTFWLEFGAKLKKWADFGCWVEKFKCHDCACEFYEPMGK